MNPAPLKICVFDEVKVTEAPLKIVYIAPRAAVVYAPILSTFYDTEHFPMPSVTLSWPPMMARAPSTPTSSFSKEAAFV